MPQLFPPNSNTLVTWSIWGGGVFVLLLLVALPFYARSNNNRVGVEENMLTGSTSSNTEVGVGEDAQETAVRSGFIRNAPV